MSARSLFPIGVLSERSGVNIETIRYYERVNLLPKPTRSEGGYRLYQPADSDRLHFIRRARDLGFSLDEVRVLLGLADEKSRSCKKVQQIAEKHLLQVRAKLADLKRMEQVLASMVRECRRGLLPDCPLLERLGSAS